MKAYLNAKYEAEKQYLISLHNRLKAWPEKKWENAKHTVKTTDWPRTTTYAIGWGVRHSVLGFLLGMGFFGLLVEVAAWDTLQKRDLPNQPIPVEILYDYISAFSGWNALFGAAGAVACLVMSLHKLRLHRFEDHTAMTFLIHPTNEEALALALKIANRRDNPKVS
jgi:hypothetical protein